MCSHDEHAHLFFEMKPLCVSLCVLFVMMLSTYRNNTNIVAKCFLVTVTLRVFAVNNLNCHIVIPSRQICFEYILVSELI